jgi:hypothetical protein
LYCHLVLFAIAGVAVQCHATSSLSAISDTKFVR